MIKKNQEIEIDENDIFKNDKLQREDSIKDLSKLIISNTEPLVLSINASWGSGKTTFVKLWQTYLKKECNVNSIYFSAWEDDFSKEPLISILGEMNSYIEKNFKVNTAVPKSFKKALSLSGKILKKVVPTAIKGATAGLIDAPQIVEDTISAISEESVKTLIENYSNDKNILIEFKKAIEKVLNEMDKEKPFVIFIDELDRCRPLYSIELLERIKHVFGIKRLIFVLSIDKSQLSESIKSQYGNINANSYLKRFIDLEYTLSNPTMNKFCDYLYKKFEIEKILQSKGIEIKDTEPFHHLIIMKKLANVFNLQLRDIEQIFTKIHMLLNVISPRLFGEHLKVIIFFEMLKSYDNRLYYNLINKKTDGIEIKNMVLPIFKDDSLYKDVSIFFENLIDSTGKNDEEYNQLIQKHKEEHIKKLNDINLFEQDDINALENVPDSEAKKKIIKQKYDKKRKEVQRLEHLIKRLEFGYDSWGDYRLNDLIETVIKKIEFADKFNFETV
jgi:translation initiation factor 2B subunit (eIF-2B alpha/beta/delta family)